MAATFPGSANFSGSATLITAKSKEQKPPYRDRVSFGRWVESVTKQCEVHGVALDVHGRTNGKPDERLVYHFGVKSGPNSFENRIFQVEKPKGCPELKNFLQNEDIKFYCDPLSLKVINARGPRPKNIESIVPVDEETKFGNGKEYVETEDNKYGNEYIEDEMRKARWSGRINDRKLEYLNLKMKVMRELIF